MLGRHVGSSSASEREERRREVSGLGQQLAYEAELVGVVAQSKISQLWNLSQVPGSESH